MLEILLLLFVGANIAFAIFNTFWLIASLTAIGAIPVYYHLVFGLASYLHVFIAIKGWEKIKQLEKEREKDE